MVSTEHRYAFATALVFLSLPAGLLDQPLVVEGKRRRKSTETFAVKHEAKRAVVKVNSLLYVSLFVHEVP